uniref:Uncharacterized protein n=1 Tax=Arundo donax TaxID=35708 RepID=A0A0A8YMQ9_ARUDO
MCFRAVTKYSQRTCVTDHILLYWS